MKIIKNKKNREKNSNTETNPYEKNITYFLEFFASSGSPGLALVFDTKIVAVVPGVVVQMLVLHVLPPS